jgi:putative sigma-54 modulation protein
MKTIIQTPDFKATQELLDFVETKIQKLDQFSDRIVEGRVVLKLDKSSTRDNKHCEIRIVIPGQDLFVERKSHSFEAAAADAIDAARQQIVKWKEKLNSI